VGGSKYCEHDRKKHYCKECGGKSLCSHGRRKWSCRECGGSQICKHDRVVSMCRQCRGFVVMAGHMRAGAKQRAKRDGLPFSITSKDILELIGDGHCPVFGICYDVSSNKSTDASATLDKIIPSLGYVKGNCAVISRRANYIKSNATVSEIRRVADWMEKTSLSGLNPAKAPKAS
jgi:hypothetical protein